MAEVDLVWMAPPGCYRCVQMPRLCVWPMRTLDAGGVLEHKSCAGIHGRNPPIRVTFEGFDSADEQVIRWSEVPDYIKWCWEQAMRET